MLFWRALLSFLLLPGIVAVIAPPLIARHDPYAEHSAPAGLLLIGLGLGLLVWCVRDFYVAGQGTLAPWDPPRHLVTSGLYHYTRNPMYVAALTLVSGWALYFLSPYLLAYVIFLGLGFHIRVVVAEEKWCADTFGAEWTTYQAHVNRWLPIRKD